MHYMLSEQTRYANKWFCVDHYARHEYINIARAALCDAYISPNTQTADNNVYRINYLACHFNRSRTCEKLLLHTVLHMFPSAVYL